MVFETAEEATMRILSFSEDAYTFWALNNEMDSILDQLADSTAAQEVLFLPSFGRRAGDDRPQFGQFDFILITESAVYPAESRWDISPGIRDGVLQLKAPQCKRHIIFQKYVHHWYEAGTDDWADFVEKNEGYLIYFYNDERIEVPIPPANSQLAKNLGYVMKLIKHHFPEEKPPVRNVLLYLYNGTRAFLPEEVKGTDCIFEYVNVDYSKDQLEKSRFLDLM
jgi:hypothetical protein